MTETPLVCVVEDDAVMRDALQMLLRNAGFGALCYASAEEFLRANRDCSRPYCLLTDVRLPDMNGIALHRHLVSLGEEPAVVMITGHADVPMAVEALKNGVADFIEKPFNPAVLLDSVRDAFERAVASHQRKAAVADIRGRLLRLTAREAEVLTMLIDGHPNKVVAARLETSTRTVEHHRAHIMEKLHARSLSQLIRMVLMVRD